MKTTTNNGVTRLDYDAIANVFAVDPPTSAQYAGQYSERPIRYMVQLVGETRKRRVYATPIGNVSALYIKVNRKPVYCEMAMDAAFHRHGA